MKLINIEKESEKAIVEQAVKVLEAGGILIYPTETCYGVGVDATNQEAVKKVLKYKSRHEGKPLSVAVTDKDMAKKYVEINDIADNLYSNHLPGPITVISNGKGKVAEGVQSEFGTLGIRIPDYPLILKIVKKLGRPITSTSANVSYKPTPYTIESLKKNLSAKKLGMIDLIIDAGQLPFNSPSTVVDTTMNNLNVMRSGSVQFDEDISDDKVVMSAKTESAQETIKFGSLVMLKYIDAMEDQPLLIALRGELGAGKTQFTKGVAQTLKIVDTISSPTFTIIDEYDYESVGGGGKFIHGDTWRVATAQEFNRIGLENYLKKKNVIAIEWADKFYEEILSLVERNKAKLVKVNFEYLSLEKRDIKVYEEI